VPWGVDRELLETRLLVRPFLNVLEPTALEQQMQRFEVVGESVLPALPKVSVDDLHGSLESKLVTACEGAELAQSIPATLICK